MTYTQNPSDYRYGIDTDAIDSEQEKQILAELKRKLLLNPLKSWIQRRDFVSGLNLIAEDGASTRYVLEALLDEDFYNNLAAVVEAIKDNGWRPAFITSWDIKFIRAFHSSLIMLRESYNEETKEG